jgi:hypothetical protein
MKSSQEGDSKTSVGSSIAYEFYLRIFPQEYDNSFGIAAPIDACHMSIFAK